MTTSERLLWEKLRRKSLGYKFVRQKPIVIDASVKPVKFYVVDFYCAEKKLVVELDGPVHEMREIEDFDREQNLLSKGFSILRVKNTELDDMESVLQRIKTKLI